MRVQGSGGEDTLGVDVGFSGGAASAEEAAMHLFFTPYHGQLLPAAALLAALIIVLGQAVFEHLFHFKATLSVVIEGLGGLMFIYLLLARRKI